MDIASTLLVFTGFYVSWGQPVRERKEEESLWRRGRSGGVGSMVAARATCRLYCVSLELFVLVGVLRLAALSRLSPDSPPQKTNKQMTECGTRSFLSRECNHG